MSTGDPSSGEERRERLERLAHQALRELPPYRAPAGLEARVLAEIERRAALPGGTAGIDPWRVTLRALLAAGCALCVPLVWLSVPRLGAQLMQALSAPGVAPLVDGVAGAGRMFVGLAQLAARLVHMIPKDWLLGGLIVTSALYAAPIALGYLLLWPHSKADSV
jgi:hypothetical protein